MIEQTSGAVPVADLWRFELRRGPGRDAATGACLLDAVSWLEYGVLGDAPVCVCPVLAMFGRALNDALPDDVRQELRPYIPRLVGTADPSAVLDRVRYLTRRAMAVHLPPLVARLPAEGWFERHRHTPYALPSADRGFSPVELLKVPYADDAQGLVNAGLRVFQVISGTEAGLYDLAWPTFSVMFGKPDEGTITHDSLRSLMRALEHLHMREQLGGPFAETDGLALVRSAASEAMAAIFRGAMLCDNLAQLAMMPRMDAAALFGTLDGLLAIGRQADPVPPARFVEALASFDAARRLPSPVIA